jgi:hypothetical protein
MGTLKKLKTDGTYSHNRVAELTKLHTKEGESIYCFDLSNATDRFPVELQEELLAEIIGPEASNL